MNKKIKELADQCIEHVDDGGYGYDVFDKEKFASMLIQACAQYVADSNTAGIPRENIPGGLLRYYGVEE